MAEKVRLPAPRGLRATISYDDPEEQSGPVKTQAQIEWESLKDMLAKTPPSQLKKLPMNMVDKIGYTSVANRYYGSKEPAYDMMREMLPRGKTVADYRVPDVNKMLDKTKRLLKDPDKTPSKAVAYFFNPIGGIVRVSDENIPRDSSGRPMYSKEMNQFALPHEMAHAIEPMYGLRSSGNQEDRVTGESAGHHALWDRFDTQFPQSLAAMEYIQEGRKKDLHPEILKTMPWLENVVPQATNLFVGPWYGMEAYRSLEGNMAPGVKKIRSWSDPTEDK